MISFAEAPLPQEPEKHEACFCPTCLTPIIKAAGAKFREEHGLLPSANLHAQVNLDLETITFKHPTATGVYNLDDFT